MAIVKEKPITVLIPTLNRPTMLRDCISALASQSYSNFEVMFINDGGQRISRTNPAALNLGEVIGQSNLQILNLEHNQGSARARNIGFQNAEGEIVAFTDDDAIPDADWLKNLNSYFNHHPLVTAVNGKIKAVSLNTSGERLRQAYYDYRQLLHSRGVLDGYYQDKYNLQTEETSLADWLSLGNCAIQKSFMDTSKDLFDDSMRLNYGRKLGRQLMQRGQLVTYDDQPAISHHHLRDFTQLINTRIANGRNFCLIDDEEDRSLAERYKELERYLWYVGSNSSLNTLDLFLEGGLSVTFLGSYICQKAKNMVWLPKSEKVYS